MKSIVEQYNVRRDVDTSDPDDPLFPVLGRLSRSPVKRLARAFRDRIPVAMLVSQSRFALGYVVDRFLTSIDGQATVIRAEQSFDDPAAFIDHIVRSIGFETESMSLSDYENVLMLFLGHQKLKRRRTILVLRDIDAHGQKVLEKIRDLIDKEVASHFGLLFVATSPANGSLDPMQPALEAISSRGAERIVLTPFVLSETREFIRDRFEHRLANDAGRGNTAPRFELYAIRLIHELSSGVLETVDLLCRKSVEIAAGSGKAAISTTEVKAAARLLGLMQDTPDEATEDAAPEHDLPEDVSGQLIVKVRGKPEKTIPLKGGKLLIGRDRLCEICVQDVQVSRVHGLFARSSAGVHYLDLGSTNGSAVNGEAAKRLVLTNNDVIAVGDVRIIYSSKGAPEGEGIDLDPTDTFESPAEDLDLPINYVGNGIQKPDKP